MQKNWLDKQIQRAVVNGSHLVTAWVSPGSFPVHTFINGLAKTTYLIIKFAAGNTGR